MLFYNPLSVVLDFLKETPAVEPCAPIVPDDYNPLLYSAFEARRNARQSFTGWANVGMQYQLLTLQCMRRLGNPFTRRSESLVQATLSMNERFGRDYGKPEFDISRALTAEGEVAVQERTVANKPFGSLIHFQRATSRRDPKILVVAPMSGHYSTLLRDTLHTLMADHEVYVTDWKNAREVPIESGSFGFDDYIRYVVEFLEHLGPDTHLLAVCQPTVPAMAATAYMESVDHPCRPASLTLMGGPIDTKAAPTKVTEFADQHSLKWFQKNVIARVPGRFAGAGRLVYPGFLQLQGFIAMNVEKHCRSHIELYKNLLKRDDEKSRKTTDFYDEYLAVCDLPAQFYLETIDRVFLRQDLANDTLAYQGRPLSAKSITRVPVLTIEGSNDDISAPGQTTAAHRLCSNLDAGKQFHYTQDGVGHYGVFSGKRWRSSIAPRITNFVRRQGSQLFDPPCHSIDVENYRKTP